VLKISQSAVSKIYLGVRERFVKPRGWFRHFAGFDDGSAIEALHVLRVGILGNEFRARMAASRGVVHRITSELSMEIIARSSKR